MCGTVADGLHGMCRPTSYSAYCDWVFCYLVTSAFVLLTYSIAIYSYKCKKPVVL